MTTRDDPKTLIRRLRVQYGMTQAAIGHRLGVSQQCVSKWEHGYSSVPPVSAEALARMIAMES